MIRVCPAVCHYILVHIHLVQQRSSLCFAATTHNKRQVVTSHSRRSFCLSLHHKNALKELSIFWHELAPPKDLKIDPDTGSRREMPFVPQGEKYFANEYSFILGCYLKLDL